MRNPFGKLLFERWWSDIPSEQKITIIFDDALMALLKEEAGRSWSRRRLWKVLACWLDHSRILVKGKIVLLKQQHAEERDAAVQGQLGVKHGKPNKNGDCFPVETLEEKAQFVDAFCAEFREEQKKKAPEKGPLTEEEREQVLASPQMQTLADVFSMSDEDKERTLDALCREAWFDEGERLRAVLTEEEVGLLRQAHLAIYEIISAVEYTGGVVETAGGHGLIYDPAWLDMAEAVLLAHKAARSIERFFADSRKELLRPVCSLTGAGQAGV